MRMPFRETAGDDSDAALGLAYRALDEGHPHDARELAQSVLIAAKAGEDLHFEALALACLAHCDRAASRLRRASDTSRRAALIFQRLGEVDGEATALTTLAHVCMLLGRNDEAVEAALLCVRLCHLQAPQPQSVFAHNCLGIAYCWSGNLEEADAALDAAIEIAGRCTPPVSSYQPRLNKAWVEAARLIDERYQTGRVGSLDAMTHLVADYQSLEAAGDADLAAPALMSMDVTVSHVLASLLASWQGDLVTARTRVDQAVGSLAGIPTWLDSLVCWGTAELAWASKDWPAAEKAFGEMKEQALAVEHEQLACVGHLLLAQVFELQGSHAQARAEYRALRRRERRMFSESLSSRKALVTWQMGARQSEQHLQQALAASKQFERWSLEDALTGIANRRCFERLLAQRLEAVVGTKRRVTVAMIDVDQFKAINDTYTHQVGDRVLKTLAAVMAATVRQNDLPARLAGDEFVVLFDDAGTRVAREVCGRLQNAIAAFDWNSIAPDLHLSISIGVAAAVAGDTVESLMERSDRSMYTVKPGWVPTGY